jgi:hypothetical protein
MTVQVRKISQQYQFRKNALILSSRALVVAPLSWRGRLLRAAALAREQNCIHRLCPAENEICADEISAIKMHPP